MSDKIEPVSEYLENCLYFTSNNMTRLINKLTQEAFMSTTLSPSYAFLMMVVIEEKSIEIGKLALILKLAPSTVTRLVDKLIIKGYLEKTQKGRTMTLNATKKGVELLPIIKESWKKLFKSYCEVLGKEFAVKMTANMAKANKILENKGKK